VDRIVVNGTQRLIGLSLSLCIQDIINGKVNLEDIHHIVAGTCAKDDKDWDEVISQYRKIYWKRSPDLGEFLARHFIGRGMVEQPRLDGGQACNIARGHWLLQ
jgi:hypothetical protein